MWFREMPCVFGVRINNSKGTIAELMHPKFSLSVVAKTAQASRQITISDQMQCLKH